MTAQLFFQKANLAFAKQNPQQASTYLAECFKLLEPQDPLVSLATVLQRDIECMVGNWSLAIELTHRMLNDPQVHHSDKVHHYFMLGQVYFILKDYKQAREYLCQADVKQMFGDTADYNFKCEFIRVFFNDQVTETLAFYTEMAKTTPTFLLKKFFLTFIFKLITSEIKTPLKVLESDPILSKEYKKLIDMGHPMNDILASIHVIL